MADDFPAELRRGVRALGANFDAEVAAATRALVRPHIDLTPAASETTDVAYGPAVRHRLDVYRPGVGGSATVVFVHGGGFVGGDKNSDGTFYVNLGRWLARQGLTAVIPNYRLAPADPWPAGARDLAQVLAWVTTNASSIAAPSAPIFVLGQSAGATHVASWLFDDEARGGPRTDLAGVLLMSGFYHLEAPLPPGPQAYFGADSSQYRSRSPISHVRRLSIPLWLSLAEFDPGWIAHHTYALARAITQANGRSPDFRYFAGHNHTSTAQSLGSPAEEVGTELLRFIRTTAERIPTP